MKNESVAMFLESRADNLTFELGGSRSNNPFGGDKFVIKVRCWG